MRVTTSGPQCLLFLLPVSIVLLLLILLLLLLIPSYNKAPLLIFYDDVSTCPRRYP